MTCVSMRADEWRKIFFEKNGNKGSVSGSAPVFFKPFEKKSFKRQPFAPVIEPNQSKAKTAMTATFTYTLVLAVIYVARKVLTLKTHNA